MSASACTLPVAVSSTAKHSARSIAVALLFLAAAIGIPASLIWDFSWESTIGIDLAWAPPHLATYAAVLAAVLAAFFSIRVPSPFRRASDVRLGPWVSPFGSWIVLWGAVAFLTATLFDRWWLASYGLTAGIWHPPQLLKAVSFFAILLGIWFSFLAKQEYGGSGAVFASTASAVAGGMVLAMLSVVILVLSYPNRQHSAPFYQTACATFPLVLAASSIAGRQRFSGAISALCSMLLFCGAVWWLPHFAARPQVSPVYQPLDHMMPPPFPLLLAVPALAMDFLLRGRGARVPASRGWREAAETGFAFFLVFTFVQWHFAAYLLSKASDNWFFAGGGKHWPFFLQIDSTGRTSFWTSGGGDMDLRAGLIAAAAAVGSSRLGIWLGEKLSAVAR